MLMTGGNKMKRKALTKIASIILAGMMTVGTVALPVDSPAVAEVYADYTKPVLKTVWKIGLNGLAGKLPIIKMLDPLTDVLFDSTMDALRNINENINQLRDEINERIDELENRVDHNTKQVLNKIKNQTFISGMGTELDKLHTSVEGISGQIAVIKKDSSMTEEEKAVEIAAQIGGNKEWNRDGSLVFRIKTLANVLAGKSFADTDGRDFYQVVFDNAAGDVMFSGEAYDAAAPYIDRVMYEYMLAYSVLTDCFMAADTVSKFTDEQVDALPAKVRNTYYSIASPASLVENEFDTITDRILNGEDRDSISSRFCLFRYKRDNDRNVFVNKGTVRIPIAKQPVKYGAAKSYSNDFNACSSLLTSGQNEVQSYLDSSAIKPGDINALLSYYRSKYPGTTFASFLKKANIDVPVGADSGFPTQAKVWVDDTPASYKRTVLIGFKGFDPYSSSPSEKGVTFYRWYRAGSSVFHFNPKNGQMFVFKKAEQPEFPETAAEIIAIDPEYGITVGVTPKEDQSELSVGSAPVKLDGRFKVDISSLQDGEVKVKGYKWEVRELPQKGITLSDKGEVSFTKAGVFHVRAVITTESGKSFSSNWVRLEVQAHGGDDEGSSIPSAPLTDADENTVFVISSSYTGLVGAEPDRIEKPAEPEPIYVSDIPEEHPAHQRLMVNVYDGTEKEINVPYTWEAEEADGISLAADGTVSFTEEGSYRVRVRSGEYVSDWFWVDAAAESEEYATITFFDDDGSLIANIVQPWGTAYEPPAVPTREGYTFAGWSPAAPEKIPADDISVTAVWVKNEDSSPDSSSTPDKGAAGNNSGSNPATGSAAAGALSAAVAAGAAAAALGNRKKKSR